MVGFKAGAKAVAVVALGIGCPGLHTIAIAADTQVQTASPVGSNAPTAKLRRMRVALNNSQTMRLDVPFTDVLVGSSEIADVIPLSDQTLYVLGKKAGTTNVSVLDAQKRIVAVVDIQVSVDTGVVDAGVAASGLNIRGQGEHVIVSGTAADAPTVDRAVQIANTLVPPERVINTSRVASPQQVMLKVRFVEVNRNAVRELGLRWDKFLRGQTGVPASQIGAGTTTTTLDPDTGVLSRVATSALASGATPFATILATFGGAGKGLDLTISALEERGLVRRLAEPNLVAMSGEAAEFHAGGEYPVPVAGETSGGQVRTTIEFKEFGVMLKFTPTVLAGGLINLKLEPEVSDIDPSVSVVAAGITIPGLSKRRAKTAIELRDGQSFALAGLLQNVTERNVDQLPWLGTIPVLGALFRSTEFRSRETELVVIVTPHLVKPGKPGALIATPLDTTIPANDVDMFLNGKLENHKPIDASAVSPHQQWVLETGAKLKGPYGHVLKATPSVRAAPPKKVVVARPPVVNVKN